MAVLTLGWAAVLRVASAFATASLIAVAVRGPMPGTSAIASGSASRSFFNDPKCLSSV